MAQPQTHSVALPGVVDLDALDDIREKLLDALHAGSVEIEAGAVERVTTNALFMLLSAAETARQAKTELTITKASDTVLSSIRKLGLEPVFAPVLKG